jgi:hypothetical protein
MLFTWEAKRAMAVGGEAQSRSVRVGKLTTTSLIPQFPWKQFKYVYKSRRPPWATTEEGETFRSIASQPKKRKETNTHRVL